MTSYLWGAANLTKKALWDAPVWAVSTTSSGLVGAARYAYAPLQNASASAISGAASRLTEEQDSIKQVVKGILGNAALEMAHNNLLCLAQSAASLYDLENLSSGKIKILKKDLKDIITNPTTFGREKWNTPEEKVPLEKLLAELEKLVLPDDSSAEQDIVIPNEVKATLPEAVDLLGSLVKENTGIFHHYLDFFKVTVDKEMAQAALPLLQAKEHLYPLLATNARPAKKQIEDMVDHLKKLEILDHTTLGSDWSTNDKTHLVKFIYYFENTLLPLYDDSGLKEPDKQQVRVLLTDLLEPFIAHSQGTLMRALGLFEAFINHPEQGLIVQTARSADKELLGAGGLVEKLQGSFTQFIKDVIKSADQELLGKGGSVEKLQASFTQFTKDFIKIAHPDLTRTYKNLEKISLGLAEKKDAEQAISILSALLSDPTQFRILRNEFKRIRPDGHFEKAINGLKDAIKKEPLEISPELKATVDCSMEYLEYFIKKQDGELTQAIKHVDGMINHPQTGLISEIVLNIKDEFSKLLQEQTRKAALPLSQAKTHLNLLLSITTRATKKQIEDAIALLEKLATFDHTTLGSDWNTVELANLTTFIDHFKNSVLPAYDGSGLKEPDKEQIRLLVSTVLDPFIAHSQGAVMRALEVFETFISHPEHGLVAQVDQKLLGTDGLVERLKDKFTQFAQDIVKTAHPDLTQTLKNLQRISSGSTQKQEAEQAISILSALFLDPTKFGITLLLFNTVAPQTNFQNAINGLKDAIKIEPLTISAELKRQIDKSIGFLEQFIKNEDGELTQAFKHLNAMINHPQKGLIAETVVTLKKEFSTLLQEQIHQADKRLLESRNFLEKLLAPSCSKQDAEKARDSIWVLLTDPKAIIKKDDWTHEQRKALQTLGNNLSIAIGNEPFLMGPFLKNQIAEVLKNVLEPTIAHFQGDVTKVLDYVNRFVNHPVDGFVAQSAGNIAQRFSAFLQDQTRQAHEVLNNTKNQLLTLTGFNPNQEDTRNAIELLKKIIATPHDYIGEDWTPQQRQSLAHLQQGLEDALRVDPFTLAPLKTEINIVLSKTLLPVILKFQGDLIKALETVKNSFIDPQTGAVRQAMDQVGTGVDKFKAQFSKYLEEQTKKAHEDLTKAQTHLNKLLGDSPVQQDFQNAYISLQQIFNNPNTYIHRDWPDQEKTALLAINNSLWALKEQAAPQMNSQLKGQIEAFLLNTLSPLIGADQGPLIQAGDRLITSLLDRFTHYVTQPTGPIRQVTQRVTAQANPNLEAAAKALEKLENALGASHKPHQITAATAVAETLRTIITQDASKTAALQPLIDLLSQPQLAAKEVLLPVLKQVQLLLDQEISAQLGDVGKISRVFVKELKTGASDILDDVERRVEKALAPIQNLIQSVTNSLGLSSPDNPPPVNPIKEMAIKLQKVLERSATREHIRQAFDAVEHLKNNPPQEILRQTVQRDQWSTEERQGLETISQNLQTILNSADPITVNEAVKTVINQQMNETFSPYVSTALDKVLDNVSGMLSKLASLSGNAISKQLASQFSWGLGFILQEAKSSMQNKPNAAPLIAMIDNLANMNKEVEKTGQWSGLWSTFKTLLTQVKTLPPIYLNGLAVMFNEQESSSINEAPFSKNIRANKLALDQRPVQTPNNQNFEDATNIEKEEFVRNTAEFTVLKTVYETVCGILPTDGDFYGKFLEGIRPERLQNPAESSKILRSKFFEKLDEAHKDGKIFILTKWYAKFVYIFIMPHAISLINRSTIRFIEYVRQAIIKRDDQGFKELENQIVQNANSFIGVLGDAYRNALDKPQVAGSLRDKLKAEFQKRESNKGYTVKELHQAVRKKAFDTFSIEFGWTDSINDWFNKKKLEENAPAKKIANGFNSMFSLLLRVFVYIPQKIGNFIISREIVRSKILPDKTFQAIVEKSVNAVRNKNGYTHALNCVIRDQLVEVLAKIQSPNPEDEQSKANRQSQFQQKEMTTLVTSLLETLEKTKCLTVDKLEQHMKDKSFVQKTEEMIDSFLIPDVVKAVVDLINVGYDSVMNKDQLERQLCNFMRLVNESYKAGTVISPEEFQRVEAEIPQLTDQILELKIADAVEKKFNFSGEKQRVIVNEYIANFKVKLEELTINRSASEAPTSICNPLNLLEEKIEACDRPQACELLKTLITQIDTFESQRNKEWFAIKARADVDIDNKDLIYTLSKQTAEMMSTKLDVKLRELNEIQTKLFRGEHVDDSKNKCLALVREAKQAAQAINQFAKSDKFNPKGPIEFSINEWKWFVDFVKKRAHPRIKQKVDGCIDLIRDPEILLEGINHFGFLPFVDKKELKPEKK